MIEELKDENTLTVSRQNEILHIIHNRVDEIWRYICNHCKVKLLWYSFDNDEVALSNSGDGSDGGSFDVELYADEICLIGEWGPAKNLSIYEYGFPTYFLYTNYEQEVKEVIKKFRDKYKNSKKSLMEKENKKKQKLINKISKLSISELESVLQILNDRKANG